MTDLKIDGYDIPYVIDRLKEHYQGEVYLDNGNIIVEYHDNDDNHKSIVFSLAVTVTKTEEFIRDCGAWKYTNHKEYGVNYA